MPGENVKILRDQVSLRETELVEGLTIASAQAVAISALLSFSDIGFHATTTRHITERALVSAGSLYTYFKSKEDILYFWILEGHKFTCSVVDEAVARTASGEERIAALVHDLTLWHIRYQTLSQLNTTQLRALKKEHYVVIREYRRKIVDALRAPVEEGVRAGKFSVPTVDIYLNAVFAFVQDVARWFPKDGGLDPEEVAKGYADLATTMLYRR
jgi:AcrR family transcriptional regulator